MAIEKIRMPKLGESVTEGTLEKWLVQPGEIIEQYAPLAEVITDKVNAEIPSSFRGVVRELTVQEGETLPVGAVVCLIETDELLHDISVSITPTTEQTMPIVQGKMRYSPAVLKLAEEHHISLEQVTGTGLDGRITRKDVQKCIAEKATTLQETVAVSVSPQSTQQTAPLPKATADIEIPITAIRKTIAKHTLRSTQEIPHAWMMIEVDVTNLVAYRNQIKSEFYAQEGYPLTYFAFFVKAVAQALQQFPMLNAVWAGDKIIQKRDINISIAVSTEEALFVPVIKHADEKTIKGIAKEIHELAHKARSGKLRLEDTQEGTFSVNNTGAFGSIQSKGIINYPQAAILQVESIVKRPVILNDNMIAPRDIVHLCLSLDHRILDGFICGKFLRKVKNILENADYTQMSVY